MIYIVREKSEQRLIYPDRFYPVTDSLPVTTFDHQGVFAREPLRMIEGLLRSFYGLPRVSKCFPCISERQISHGVIRIGLDGFLQEIARS